MRLFATFANFKNFSGDGLSVLAGVAPNNPPLVGVPPKPPNAGVAGLAPAQTGVTDAKPVLASHALCPPPLNPVP
jgi:hypothetical protein